MFANTTLMLRPVTVFAPTNMAFQEFPRSERDESLVLYHISKSRRISPNKIRLFTDKLMLLH